MAQPSPRGTEVSDGTFFSEEDVYYIYKKRRCSGRPLIKIDKDVTLLGARLLQMFPGKPKTKEHSTLKAIRGQQMGLSASGMRYVLRLVDQFSKWLGAYAIKDKAASTVAHVIF
ncbi:hypothetical protein OSTOST_05690 [Ostertagia ostertagi]